MPFYRAVASALPAADAQVKAIDENLACWLAERHVVEDGADFLGLRKQEFDWDRRSADAASGSAEGEDAEAAPRSTAQERITWAGEASPRPSASVSAPPLAAPGPARLSIDQQLAARSPSSSPASTRAAAALAI